MKSSTAKIRPKEISNTQLIDDYKKWLRVERDNSEKTIKLMLFFTKDLLNWLEKHHKDLDILNQNVVNDYLMACRNRYSDNSLVPVTANLRKLLVHFLRKDIHVKMKKMTPPNRDKIPLTREEVKAIFQTASEDILAEVLLKTLYYSGLRENELICLDVEDVDLDRFQITVKHGKGNRYRVVNITRDCGDAIQRWLMRRPQPRRDHEGALFISTHGKRISKSFLHELTRKYAAKSGIMKRVYPHLYRVTMISHMAENGCTINEIQNQSGHRDIAVLLGYVQHTSKRLRKAYDDVFEKNDEAVPPIKTGVSGREDKEHYKKLAFQRYLAGEIDRDTLNSMLQVFEDDKPRKISRDVAYS